MGKVYITAAEQISIQKPLCEDWMTDPVLSSEPYLRATDPDFRKWFSPAVGRRLGVLLKRALTLSSVIAQKTGVGRPDAVIAGTGLGCMDNSEKLLSSLCENGEKMFSPTLFMQSTHNTIASLVSIHSRNHGYNTTYTNKDVSFDTALYDAWMQFLLGKISTAAVGGFDELTPSSYTLLERTGYLGGGTGCVGSEAAAMVQLSSVRDGALCELSAMRILYKSGLEELRNALSDLLSVSGLGPDGPDAVMTGVNGNPSNDSVYGELVPELFPSVPVLRYKNVFGTNYAASAYSLYAMAHCLSKGTVPPCLACGSPLPAVRPRSAALFNHSGGKHFSIIILKALC